LRAAAYTRDVNAAVSLERIQSVARINRMMAAIAARVGELIGDVFDAEATDVDDPSTLRLGQADLVVVGRQHLDDDGNLRLGPDIVADVAERVRPRLVIYVVPGHLDPQDHRVDVAALDRVARVCPVYVLEFAELHARPRPAAARAAQRCLVDPPSVAVGGRRASAPAPRVTSATKTP
jgi:hypothetical protein